MWLSSVVWCVLNLVFVCRPEKGSCGCQTPVSWTPSGDQRQWNFVMDYSPHIYSTHDGPRDFDGLTPFFPLLGPFLGGLVLRDQKWADDDR